MIVVCCVAKRRKLVFNCHLYIHHHRVNVPDFILDVWCFNLCALHNLHLIAMVTREWQRKLRSERL